ncbi:MAG: helix-turn-helix transcriptional regulator [Ruminococcaceae bacterium]|nr:helix-turn-helix transcriptional regulator [Oscillospiraceae bacterium]
MTPIYQRIEELCRKNGINVTALCQSCKISRASLSDYKTGRKKSLSADTLSKIAEYFGVSVDYLYGGEAPIPDETSLKVALFGGAENVTDEMWDEVKRYARYIKERQNDNK